MLAGACGDSVSDGRGCQVSEGVRIETVPAGRLPDVSAIVTNEDGDAIELARMTVPNDATYVERGFLGSYLRFVISRTDAPTEVLWKDPAGVVDSVKCTLGDHIVEGLVDDGTAELWLDGVKSNRPVAMGEGLLSGPVELFVP